MCKKYNSKNNIKSVLFLLLTLLPLQIFSQAVIVPRVSPKASVTQTVGLTDVTINYGRPGVKGRSIWGELVPFNTVWRTGANEATTISFTDELLINGTRIPAGSYSLFTIPSRGEWTIILNRIADQWGAFQYDSTNDALRLEVSPTQGEFTEWLNFSFENLSESSSDVVMRWEKLKISFKIEADVQTKVMNNAAGALMTSNDWFEMYQYADYFYKKGKITGDVLSWIEKSVKLNENYLNLTLKSKILSEMGDLRPAVETGEKALLKAQEMKKQPSDLEEFKSLLDKWKNKKDKK